MRLVQCTLPEESRAAVLDALDEEGVDYAVVAGAEGGPPVVQFPLPTPAVETVLDALRDAGLDDRYTVVTSVETAMTTNLDSLEDRFVAGDEEGENVAREEIRTRALGLNPSTTTYYVMTLLSAVVALAGLLLDSPAIVVGSMVIAPQVGSALTTSVGVVLDDRKMVVDGLRSQVLGLVLVVVATAVIGWSLRTAQFVPVTIDLTTVSQIRQRISPGLLSLAVGVCAGAAGAIGAATALPVSLVGVMVAAALIPAAAAVGVGIAWNLPVVAVGAFVLLVVNVASINLVGAGTLWAFGYRPAEWDPTSRVPTLVRRHWSTAAALVVLLVAFGAAGVAVTDQMAFENGANRAVTDVLERPAYDPLELVAVRATFPDGVGTSSPEVTVVVKRPADEDYPALAPALRAAVSDATGRSVGVELQYVERVRAPATTASDAAARRRSPLPRARHGAGTPPA